MVSMRILETAQLRLSLSFAGLRTGGPAIGSQTAKPTAVQRTMADEPGRSGIADIQASPQETLRKLAGGSSLQADVVHQRVGGVAGVAVIVIDEGQRNGVTRKR